MRRMKVFASVSLSAFVLTLLALQGSAWAQQPKVWQGLKYVAAAMPDPLADQSQWQNRSVCVFESALSPARLIRMKSPWIRFFGNLAEYGAQGPTFFMIDTPQGPKTFGLNQPVSGQQMSASWIVASFQGAKGWEQFDAPWLLSLQKRPTQIELTADGLTIHFGQADTGYIYSMPLYGYEKLPQQADNFCAKYHLPSSGVEPWKWRQSVPADVTARCDLWSRIAKAWPVGFQESFSVDPATAEITFCQDYRWMTIHDAWNTQPLRFAPLSPTLGLAWKYPGFPMTFSAKIEDPHYFTAFGPFVGAYNVNRLDVTMKVLQYTNQLEKLDVPANPTPEQTKALDIIRRIMKSKFPDSWRYFYDQGVRDNFVWNIVADEWYPKALPFVDPALRKKAAASMRIYMDDDVLIRHSPLRGMFIFHGPGIGSWGGFGDAGKFSTNSLQAIWAYGQYTGDWNLIRQRWPIIQRFFITPYEADWTMFGRGSIAELGDEAPPCSAYARIAWAMGDKDQYLYGVYMFARELVDHYVKQLGGQYFYEHQPYDEFKPMPPMIYPTDVWGSTMGWQVDGPIWGRTYSPEHQSSNRWFRFHDPDVGRFYRDHLASAVRKELMWYTQAAKENMPGLYRAATYKNWLTRDAGHAVDSLPRLLSFLVGEPFKELNAVAPMSAFERASGPGGIAVAYAYLRSMVPVEHVQLVPKDTPASPFVLGLERRGLSDLTSAAQTMRVGLSMQPRWDRWNMPKAAPGSRDRSRSFGTISGDFGDQVAGLTGSKWISYGCHVAWVDAIQPRKLPDVRAILNQQTRTPVMVIGPFSNADDDQITEKAYPPEQGYQSGARYPGVFGPVAWKPATMGAGRKVDLKKALYAADQDPRNTLAYVQQYVWAPRAMQVYLLVGHYGGAQAWIDGQRVLSVHGNHGRLVADRSAALGQLKAGWNRVLVKIEDVYPREFEAEFRIVGLDRLPIPSLRFAAAPPGQR